MNNASAEVGLQPMQQINQVRSEYTELMELARAMPDRDDDDMIRRAQAIGARFGEDGYYSYKIGGEEISGPTVLLMEALEKIWGYTLTRVVVADVYGNDVTLRCTFVDLKTGNFKERPAIFSMSEPPGKFANKPDQRDRWRTMQLQSAVSKATRNILEHGLPRWFVAPAYKAAREDVAKKVLNGKPLEVVIEEAIKHWKEQKLQDESITVQELEGYLGMPRGVWSAYQILELRELAKSLKAERTTLEQTFGPIREELAQKHTPSSPPPPVGTDTPSPPADNRSMPPPSASAMDSLGLSGAGTQQVLTPDPVPVEKGKRKP
jgi:hypothetical protein